MCQADGCDKEKYYAKPYCRMHLARLKRTGTLGGFKEIYNYDKVCKTKGCEKPHVSYTTQLCEKHHQQKLNRNSEKAKTRYYYEQNFNGIDYDSKAYDKIDNDDLWEWVRDEILGQ